MENASRPLAADPLRPIRIVRRYTRAGVYIAIPASLPFYYFFLDMTLPQLITGQVVGFLIAIPAVEGAFAYVMQLQKRSVYPGILAVELSRIPDLKSACDLSLHLVSQWVQASAAMLAWLDDAQRLVPVAARGMPRGWLRQLPPPTLDDEPVRIAVQEQRAVMAHPSQCPCWSDLFDDDHLVAFAPLVSRDRVAAVISLVGRRKRMSDLRDRRLLAALGIVLGLSLDNMRLSIREYQSILRVLCRALDMRDQATEGHSQRVARLATLVAQKMGLPRSEVRKVEQAALLHDVGKIGIADAVLSKPSTLGEEEWAEMRRHPVLGFDILKDIETLKEAAEIVRAHHERFDGNGYPLGLKDGEIPLGARIFAVVDAYDAITSFRPYRRARSHQEAIEEIVRWSGRQFDPQVVEAFLELEAKGLIGVASSDNGDIPNSGNVQAGIGD